MTPTEFKAWFDGFTEAMSGAPTKAQWSRIKERVAEIDGKPVTERVFVDRYWPNYIYCSSPTWTVARGVGSGTTTVGNITSATTTVMANVGFNSQSAMLALGKADYSATN